MRVYFFPVCPSFCSAFLFGFFCLFFYLALPFFVNNFAPMDYLSLLYSYYGFLEVILNIQILEFKQLQLYGKING